MPCPCFVRSSFPPTLPFAQGFPSPKLGVRLPTSTLRCGASRAFRCSRNLCCASARRAFRCSIRSFAISAGGKLQLAPTLELMTPAQCSSVSTT
ncbi:hypothetical protein MRX96_043304 [Rhipicephalus microplus]